MNKEDLEKIIEDYSWIKVKKFIDFASSSSDWDSSNDRQHYLKLMEHHERETEFLINKCRELAKELLEKGD